MNKADKYAKGFQSPDLLGNHPMIGVIIFIVSILIFGILAYLVMQNTALVQWDLVNANRIHEIALNNPTWIKDVMAAGTFIGLQGHAIIGVALALYFLIKRFWKEFIITAVLFASSGALWLLVSAIFNRARPEFAVQLVPMIKFPSFPSGHVISEVVCYTLLAYFIAPRMKSVFGKIVVITLALIMLIYLAYSRFYLGAHYPTDIFAGIAVGFALTSLVILIVESLFKKGGRKNAEEKETITH